MTDYPNWFNVTAAVPFARHLEPLAHEPGLRFLQIGAFTGDATVWLMDNILTDDTAELDDVDTWEGSPGEPEHMTWDWRDVQEVHEHRTAKYRSAGNLSAWKMTSQAFFESHAVGGYEFIYVDGSHEAPDVLYDAVQAWRFLDPGGLLAFDDYTWRSGNGPTHDPFLAIDAFLTIHQGLYEPVERAAQVWIRKPKLA